MLQRKTTLDSGIEITQQSETNLSWEYYSDVLGKTLEGTLTHTNDLGGGWTVDIDTWAGLVVSAPLYVGMPQSLPDAIREISKMIKRTEDENTRPDPRDEQRKRELDELFGPIIELT